VEGLVDQILVRVVPPVLAVGESNPRAADPEQPGGVHVDPGVRAAIGLRGHEAGRRRRDVARRRDAQRFDVGILDLFERLQRRARRLQRLRTRAGEHDREDAREIGLLSP
jgi:hypothetical protein